jgi:hypothetical protein
MSSRDSEVTRVMAIPNIAEEMTEDTRVVPYDALVGPFDFPLSTFQRRLQMGNQLMGDMGRFNSNAPCAAKAFASKKLMDVMLRIREKMRNSPQRLKIKRIFLLVRLKPQAIAEGKDAEWVRNCGDLAEAYSAVDRFSFYFEVMKKSETESEGDGITGDMRDVDEIVAESFKMEDGDKMPTEDALWSKKRKRDHDCYLANKNQQTEKYNAQHDSSDLAMIFSTAMEYGQMMNGSVGDLYAISPTDGDKNLADLTYAPSRVFNLSAIAERCNTPNAREAFRLPKEFHTVSEVLGDCIDLCKGMSFTITGEDFMRNHFGFLAFPDIRRRSANLRLPVPDDETNAAVLSIALDMNVQTYGNSAFESTKDRLTPSRLKMGNACANKASLTEKREIRCVWQKQASVALKSIFNEKSNISFSIKKMVSEWERLNEINHGEGQPNGIPIKSINLQHCTNLDRQCAYLSGFYDFGEQLGLFCHHSIFVALLIDSKHACRIGQTKGPHCILFGGPGSGKSHLLAAIRDCLQKADVPMWAIPITSMSKLAWAVADPKKKDNPDTMQMQVVIIWDEVPASYLGANDTSGKKGEADDNVALMKEMMSAFILSYSRNVEVMNYDGTKGRGNESNSINNQPLFLGGMNRPPTEIADAFQRRVCFKTCVQSDRADGVTFEHAKAKEQRTREDVDRNRWMLALRDNAQLHLLVSTAEHCGVILPPDLSTWDALGETFQKEVAKYVKVPNFEQRVADVKHRCDLVTRQIAIFETYQQGADKVMTFDEIVSKLPEVEKRTIAGERLCVAVMSSLDDVVFPLMHRAVLDAIAIKWPTLEPADNVYTFGGTARGDYAVLPLATFRPKGRESVDCTAKKEVFKELRTIILANTQKYKLSGTEALTEAAVEALFSVMSPDHPVLVATEDSEDQTVTVYVSLTRLRTRDTTIAEIIKKITRHDDSTQLMMLPYMTDDGGALPQLMANCAGKTGAGYGFRMDDEAFARRCADLHLDPAENLQYHPGNTDRINSQKNYPDDFADEILSRV